MMELWYSKYREKERRYMPILKFAKENLRTLHFFVESVNFPVAVASYSDWEEEQISYLENNYKSLKMNTESICIWCINHQIKYQIIYPISKILIIKNPYKYIKYLQLERKLNSLKYPQFRGV